MNNLIRSQEIQIIVNGTFLSRRKWKRDAETITRTQRTECNNSCERGERAEENFKTNRKIKLVSECIFREINENNRVNKWNGDDDSRTKKKNQKKKKTWRNNEIMFISIFIVASKRGKSTKRFIMVCWPAQCVPYSQKIVFTFWSILWNGKIFTFPFVWQRGKQFSVYKIEQTHETEPSNEKSFGIFMKTDVAFEKRDPTFNSITFFISKHH